MTREEAIEMLKKDKEQRGNCFISDALDMAIKALEQEPCEDAISRAEALKAINNMDIPEDMCTFEIMSHIGVEIGTLPSVAPIRPKGYWIDHSDEGYVECPKCGSATNCDDNINDLHFCFSCGAEMKGSEDV